MNYHKNITYSGILVLFTVLLFTTSSCTHIKPVPAADGSGSYTVNTPWKQQNTTEQSVTPSNKVIHGKASWYGKKFHGRRTASGERFNMHNMTAAHRTLPFGTRLLVTNKSNGKSVEVRVNDRGPRSHRLVIDLSYGAAKKIGIKGCGDVTIEEIAKNSVESRISEVQIRDSGACSFQAGSFQSSDKALSLKLKLEENFDPVAVVSENGLYKVRVGYFTNQHEAEILKKDLEDMGYRVFPVRMAQNTQAIDEQNGTLSRRNE